MSIEKQKLLQVIDSVSFAINDINLYLDTHPNDEEALAKYEKYKIIRKQAVKEFTENFGPLTADNVTSTGQWAWVKTPWPWEKEDC